MTSSVRFQPGPPGPGGSRITLRIATHLNSYRASRLGPESDGLLAAPDDVMGGRYGADQGIKTEFETPRWSRHGGGQVVSAAAVASPAAEWTACRSRRHEFGGVSRTLQPKGDSQVSGQSHPGRYRRFVIPGVEHDDSCRLGRLDPLMTRGRSKADVPGPRSIRRWQQSLGPCASTVYGPEARPFGPWQYGLRPRAAVVGHHV